MSTRDPSVVVIRVLAGLIGLPALAGVLVGGYVAAVDLLDGDTGDWDGFGLFVGGFLLVVAGPPLVIALVAVRARRAGVVRGCGAALGLLGLVLAAWVEYVEAWQVAPAMVLVLLSCGSMLAAWLRLEGHVPEENPYVAGGAGPETDRLGDGGPHV